MIKPSPKAPFSVLMSVYKKEQASFLKASLDSVFAQTLCADEVVLIKDGPLTPELDAIISDMQRQHSELRVVAYAENRGLGHCLNDGLQLCKHDIVARMDTDDICMPQRFEQQYAFLQSHPDYALVGAWIDEFIDSPNQCRATRKVPETASEIMRYAKSRCPFNHPTVMYRKQAVLDAEGYLVEYFPEDYFLWIRMLMNGAKCYNIQHSLLWFRYSPETVARRGGWRYAKDEVVVQINIHRLGFTSLPQMLKNMTIRFITRIMPMKIRVFIYSLIRKV